MPAAERALRLVAVEGEAYRVESGTGDDAHSYWVNPNRLRCDCPAGLRRRQCKHLNFVLAALEAGARV